MKRPASLIEIARYWARQEVRARQRGEIDPLEEEIDRLLDTRKDIWNKARRSVIEKEKRRARVKALRKQRKQRR